MLWVCVIAAAWAQEPPAIALEAAMDRAEASGWSVRASDVQIAGAEARVRAAKAAELPVVGVQAGLQLWNAPIEVEFGAAKFEVRDQVTWSATARVVQPITGVFALREGAEAAESGVEAAKRGQEAAAERARYAAADVYFAALEADAQLDIAAAQVKSLEARVDRLSAGVSSGAVLRNDLLQAQVALAQARQAVIFGAAQRDTARDRLGLAVAAEGPLRPEAAEAPLRGEPPAVDVLARRALASRPDLAALKAQIEASDHASTAMSLQRIPQLSATGAYVHTAGQSFGVEPDAAYIGLSLDAPLFSWGRARATLDAADAATHGIEAQLAEAEATARVEVAARRRALVAASEGWRVSTDSVAQAEENLRLFQVRYEAGSATLSDVLEAEASLVRARSNVATSYYAARRAEEGLALAVGGDPWSAQP